MRPGLPYQLGDTDSDATILSFLRADAVFDFTLSTNRANWIQVSCACVFIADMMFWDKQCDALLGSYGNATHWLLSSGCTDLNANMDEIRRAKDVFSFQTLKEPDTRTLACKPQGFNKGMCMSMEPELC